MSRILPPPPSPIPLEPLGEHPTYQGWRRLPPPQTVVGLPCIDLTRTSPPPAQSREPSRPLKRRRSHDENDLEEYGFLETGSPGPSTKRSRQDRATRLRRAAPPIDAPVINLDDEDDEAVATGESQLSEPTTEPVRERPMGKLSSMSCIVCMDTPTDLSSTTCGHLFCHACLIQALQVSENQIASRGSARKSQCPVCRKKINRSKDVILLALKKRPREEEQA